MDKALKSLVLDELKPGEQLIWQERTASQRGKQKKASVQLGWMQLALGLAAIFITRSVAANGLGGATF